MATTDPTAMPDPSPEPRADGASTPAAAAPSPLRLFYWSVRRELWENRFLYVVPLIVAGVCLFGFAIRGHVHFTFTHHGRSAPPNHMPTPLDITAFAVMLTYLVITVSYCLGSLHNERGDRSILFWKSLPVSDGITVIAKASIPMIALPLIAFAVTVVAQAIMLAAARTILSGGGAGLAPWAQMSPLPMWAALLYHLLTVHTLYYAPIYGWLMLVSAWARRAAFLWATLPIAAVLIVEKLVFNTSVFADMLLSRLSGGPGAIAFPPPADMPMQAPTLANLAAFLATPGLWLGLALFAAFLAGAARLRRYQGPI